MPSCAFRKCSNNSRNTNKGQGVTFHSFPKNPRCKEKWIEILQEDLRDEHWFPTRFSRVCSAHFEEDDFHMTPLGRRKIKIHAIPVLRSTSELSKYFTSYLVEEPVPSLPLQNVHVLDTDSIHKCDTPTKNNLEKRKKDKSGRNTRKQKTQIKCVKDKNISLHELIDSLRTKKYFNKENFNELTQKAEEANKDFLFSIAKKRRIIPPSVRKFYATLHYYSPAAYKYVREKFNNILPHPRTIAHWFVKSDVSPGFTQQAFENLREKSEQKPVIATLVVDEMALSQRTTWNGCKSTGLVDEGLGPKDEIATQVYVFMLVSNTEDWKIPLGYFYINGLRAEQRANLIQMCVTKCYHVGVNVIALTFDGGSANVATAEVLGCNFQDIDSLETTFPHPACSNKRVAVFFDACDMLKLVRNTFESKKVMLSDAGRVAWLHLVKLQNLQENEGSKFANKLTVRHIAFRNQIMTVNLASQLLSRNVAKVLTLCSEMLTGNSFRNVEATVEFIETFNNLFDILNSKTCQQGFERPICAENETEIMNFLTKAENYIKSLEIYYKVKITRGNRIKLTITKKNVVKAKCKMGFLGFLIDIQSLKYLYAELVQQNKAMDYLSTYRFSQDHIELFFSLIRQHGGHNNDPTTEQFRGIYKKILCHPELRTSFTALAASTLEEINTDTSGFRESDSGLSTKPQSAGDEQCETNSHVLSSLSKETDIIEIS